VEIRFDARQYQVDEIGENGIGDAGRKHTGI